MARKRSLKEALSDELSAEELKILHRAYDVIGDIAIIDIPDELVSKEKMIAQTLLDMHKNVNVVCKKVGVHSGEFRLQKLKVLAGEKRKETEYKENGIRLKLNVEKCYFSPRLSTERKRVMELIKKGEDVLVMFSGVGPYPIVIGKNTSAKSVVGVEKNPVAHEYAEANVKLNKLLNVDVIKGDVRVVVPTLDQKFDRVLMPLPMGGEDFLDVALSAVKDEGMVHFYDFLDEKDFKLAEQKVKDACKAADKKCKIKEFVKCGQFGPKIFRVCVDFKVS